MAAAVLLFYSSSRWTETEREDWYHLTGRRAPTSDALCHLARRVQAQSARGKREERLLEVYRGLSEARQADILRLLLGGRI